MKLTHASVFSGIGGPEVAATMLGWENVFHCEINPFGKAVLDYWYPKAKSYDDITKTDFSEWRGKINVLTGGFPCQPFSYAGQRRGAQDDRYLWPYMFRCIDQIRPDWVVAENVGGILTMVEQGEVSQMASTADLFGAPDHLRRYRLRETFTLQRICNDLESHGYEVQPVLIPACAVGAPHRRDRVFIVGCRKDFTPDTYRRHDGGVAGANEEQSAAQRVQERHEIQQSGESGKVRSEGTTIPEDTLHGGQLHGQNDEQRSERNIGDAGAGDSERIRCETQGITSADTDCNRGSEMDKHLQSQFSDGAEFVSNGREWNAADTGSTRLEGADQPGSSKGEKRMCVRRDTARYDSEDVKGGNVADSSHARCSRENQSGDKETDKRMHIRRAAAGLNAPATTGEQRGYCGERWQNFPTVSPVHRGNDGLSFSLDDLTISPAKWRTESLKAYGNAIVPQVMEEIFRAIESTYYQ